jgi:3-methyladenine DNA glycosylase Mpg
MTGARVGKRLSRAFYRRDPRLVAPQLLNKVLVAADGRRARIVDDGIAPPGDPAVSARIGIRHAAEEPWRWYVQGNLNVSKP